VGRNFEGGGGFEIGNIHRENDNRVHFGEKVSRFVYLRTRWNRFENNVNNS